MNPLESLPDADFKHSMRFSRGLLREFYGKTDAHAAIISQRADLLVQNADRYAMLSTEGEALLDETTELAAQSGGINSDAVLQLKREESPATRCQILGANWEPDYLLLKAASSTDSPRLVGGCVCFPSHWSLEQKFGLPVSAIHSPVPRLNADLEKQIDGFLYKMKPGISWERMNWGLAATTQLNLHPQVDPPSLHRAIKAEEVSFRVEWQSLVSLPESKGILFGIRLHIMSLPELMKNDEATRRLHRALSTMSSEMARYKGLAESRERLLSFLVS